MYKFVQEGVGFTPDEIDDLVQKRLVINLNPENDYYLDSFVVADKFAGAIYVSEETIPGTEFWNRYPRTLYIEGKRFPARNADKDRFIEDYAKETKLRVDKHRRIMDALEYAVQNRLITMGIRKWFDSKQWESMEEEMKTRKEAGTNELPGEKIY